MTCKGCGTSRAEGHCQYPSNPAYNAQFDNTPNLRRDPKSNDPVIAERRQRANLITKQNRARTTR